MLCLLLFRLRGFFPLNDGVGIAQFGALHTEITNNDVIEVGMLEHHVYGTGLHAIAAVGAFGLIHDKRADLVLSDSAFGTGFFALAALGAHIRPVLAGIGELGVDAQSGFLGVDLVIMLDAADLETQTAAGAIVFMDSYPHLILLVRLDDLY
jgi:hypothetical protein